MVSFLGLIVKQKTEKIAPKFYICRRHHYWKKNRQKNIKLKRRLISTAVIYIERPNS